MATKLRVIMADKGIEVGQAVIEARPYGVLQLVVGGDSVRIQFRKRGGVLSVCTDLGVAPDLSDEDMQVVLVAVSTGGGE